MIKEAYNSPIVTATDITTDVWVQVIKKLVAEAWKVTYKYDNFDAGIDYDFVILEKDGEEILFGWDNWFEGEVQSSEPKMIEIEQMMNQSFKRGESQNLTPGLITLHRKWQVENKWG
ncbi:MAG: hypothetical protein ACFB10_21120 [Salibacteraceae bacterium]